MEPMLEEMSDLMGGKLRFAKVDVDQHRELAIRYEVNTLPTLLIFEKGRPVDTISGVPPRYSLISRLEKHL
jgi:thioredoxin 1